jgi:hypothetical protein
MLILASVISIEIGMIEGARRPGKGIECGEEEGDKKEAIRKAFRSVLKTRRL